jgi:hypothetical protein
MFEGAHECAQLCLDKVVHACDASGIAKILAWLVDAFASNAYQRVIN